MSWEQYAQILAENENPEFRGWAEEAKFCPISGDALQRNPQGVWYCPFGDGYRRQDG